MLILRQISPNGKSNYAKRRKKKWRRRRRRSAAAAVSIRKFFPFLLSL